LAGRVEDASYARSKPLIVKGLDEPVRVCRVISTAPLPPVPRPLGPKKRGPPLWVTVIGAICLAIVVGFVVATRGGSGVPSVTVVPNSVAVIDPDTNRLVADIAVGNAPASVVGGAGYVWVVNGINGTISRIDPSSRSVAGPAFSVGVKPSTLAVGDGSLWVGSLSEQAVVQVDPSDEEPVARFDLPEPPIGVAFAAGRLYAEGGNIARIDPASGKVLSRALAVDPGAGAWPMAPIIAADDAVWAAIYANVIEFDPQTLTEISELPGPALHGGVAVGGGAVWVPDLRDHTVWRIDPRVGGFNHTFEVGRQPTGIAFGENAAWVSVSDGTVDRLDAVSGARTTIEVGRTPTSSVVAYGVIWVTVS
jgi:streptogramin lyase